MLSMHISPGATNDRDIALVNKGVIIEPSGLNKLVGIDKPS